MRIDWKIVGMAALFGIAAWGLDAVVDWCVFAHQKAGFSHVLLQGVSPHDLFMRTVIFLLFVVFGVLAGILVAGHKAAQKQAMVSESSLRTVFDSIGDGVIVTGLDSHIRMINRVACALTGWEADAALGRPLDTVFRIINSRTREPATNPVARVLNEGIVVGMANHTALIAKHGREYQIADSAAPIQKPGGPMQGVVLVFRDVTESYRKDEALRLSEIKHRELFENMTDGAAVYEPVDQGRDFILRDMNRAGLAICRVTLDEVVGRRITEAFPGIKELGLLEVLRQVNADGKSRVHPLRAYGDRRLSLWVENHVFKLPNGQVVAVFHDETERKLEEEQLRQLQKMNSIGQLAGGVAHDYNNMLAGILGYAEMLERRLDDKHLVRYARNITTAARRAADLTAQLLSFARKGHYEYGNVDVHAIISEVVELLEHTIDPNIRITRTLEADPPFIHGDSTQIQSAIMNLAVNARDAMPQGGELTFVTDIVELDEDYCRDLPYNIVPGRFLRIAVTDSGQGMDQEIQRRIFEPFFTTKPVGKGTGMGLAAVYGIVKHHRGAVNVYSEPGHGATFKLYFPLAATDKHQAMTQDSSPTLEWGNAHILVVDDEALCREIARDMLNDLGYEVTICEDGVQAMAYFRASWETVDLVLLDMVMPNMGGYDTFLAMHRINPKVRVLLASGYSINGEAREILEAGVLGFVQKPFDTMQLSRAVREALEDSS